MDWFEALTGFRETNYAETRSRLRIEGKELRSLVNGRSYGIGELELVSLRTLRQRVENILRLPCSKTPKFSEVSGDVRSMHRMPENDGALFQVASQFNLLEMTAPSITPEHGVARYQLDRTQGPACAIAAGAATIYRNYFAQTPERQLDALAAVGAALAEGLGRPVESLWQMRNGYALCTPDGLAAIADYLNKYPDLRTRELTGKLCIGLHRDVEVTETPKRQHVSQVFCSALPVAYGVPSPDWEPFARLILQGAYEATLLAAVLNARRGVSNVVFLTRLGGGAFGNDPVWIQETIRYALDIVAPFDLDVRLVNYRGKCPVC